MFNFVPVISLLILIPLIGALSVFSISRSGEDQRNAQWIGLWVSVINLLIILYLGAFLHEKSALPYAFQEFIPWFPGIGFNYSVGVDGISYGLILLTGFLVPLCLLATWDSITYSKKAYVACFLLLESFLIGVFSAQNLLLFFVFYEAVLLPMYLLIGIWGGANRVYAAIKFFLYTMLGSVLLLIALIYLFQQYHTLEASYLIGQVVDGGVQKWLWAAFFFAFAVKIPMIPFHTWLPDAHVQAPTGASVILASVLLKIGAYGFLRFSIPLFPDASLYFQPYMIGLSLVAIIYASCIALVQTDIKKLIAYTSIAHMGYVTLGFFSFQKIAMLGGYVQMLSHGCISAALFMSIGILYDRFHTRVIRDFGGLASVLPRFGLFFFIFILGAIGLPGTSGFVGEILVLIGSYKISGWITLAAGLGIILSAIYGLWLYARIMFGSLPKTFKDVTALSFAEKIPMIFLAGAILLLGVYPQWILNLIDQSLANILQGIL